MDFESMKISTMYIVFFIPISYIVQSEMFIFSLNGYYACRGNNVVRFEENPS